MIDYLYELLRESLGEFLRKLLDFPKESLGDFFNVEIFGSFFKLIPRRISGGTNERPFSGILGEICSVGISKGTP